MPQKLDLTGRCYHNYVVIGLGAAATKRQRARWAVQCDCGRAKSVRADKVYFGCEGKNCLVEPTSSLNRHLSPLTYNCWVNLRGRCNNKNNPAYHHYGGRGITVSPRWRSFDNFLEDMGPRPSAQHSIDRIDVNGDYAPGNCRWATQAQQCANRRPRNEWPAKVRP